MIDDLIKDAKKIIDELKIKHIHSRNFGDIFEVDTSNVRIITKPGRTEIHCDCENGTKYCNSPVLCKHKIAAILLKAQ